MTFSVALVGAAAIGSWLGDAFDRAGWRVSMVARGASLAAVRKSGLRVAPDGTDRTSRRRMRAPNEFGVEDCVALTVSIRSAL